VAPAALYRVAPDQVPGRLSGIMLPLTMGCPAAAGKVWRHDHITVPGDRLGRRAHPA
jgi:hypothetical protein